MREKTLGVGIIGCGTFCDAYIGTFKENYSNIRVISCSDLDMERANATAKKWELAKAYSTEEMLQDSEVDLVLIVTTPGSHYLLTKQALLAGKHVYCEKPMATSFEQARELKELAASKGLITAAAPDTFLSTEFQTVRKLIDDGAIGKVISFTANFAGPGADMWHPNPEFLYKAGGGPVLDMAPYFISNLVALFGAIDRIFGFATRGFDTRIIHGNECSVDVLTDYCGVISFKDGTIGNINMSYDRWKSMLPGLEIYGTDGVIFAPDPNTMKGDILLLRADKFRSAVENEPEFGKKMAMIYGPDTMKLFETVETVEPRLGNQRGRGIFDIAEAITSGRAPRISAEFCVHVTEAMFALDSCKNRSAAYTMETDCDRPESLYKA